MMLSFAPRNSRIRADHIAVQSPRPSDYNCVLRTHMEVGLGCISHPTVRKIVSHKPMWDDDTTLLTTSNLTCVSSQTRHCRFPAVWSEMVLLCLCRCRFLQSILMLPGLHGCENTWTQCPHCDGNHCKQVRTGKNSSMSTLNTRAFSENSLLFLFFLYPSLSIFLQPVLLILWQGNHRLPIRLMLLIVVCLWAPPPYSASGLPLHGSAPEPCGACCLYPRRDAHQQPDQVVTSHRQVCQVLWGEHFDLSRWGR